MRVALEGLAIEMAIENLSAEDIKHLSRLNKIINKAAKEGDTATMLAGNSDFHMTIYRASGSELLVDLIQITWLCAGPLLTLAAGRSTMLKNAQTAHCKLLSALRSRDAKFAHAAIALDINQAARQLDAILADGVDG